MTIWLINISLLNTRSPDKAVKTCSPIGLVQVKKSITEGARKSVDLSRKSTQRTNRQSNKNLFGYDWLWNTKDIIN